MLRRKCVPPLLAAVALLFCGAEAARACSCAGSPTVLEAFESAPVVVVIRADAVEKAEPGKEQGAGYGGIVSWKAVVERVYKGGLKPGDVLTLVQGGGTDCVWAATEENIGQRFLVYLYPPKSGQLWHVSVCGRSSGFAGAREDLLYLDNLKRVRGRTRLSGTLRFDGGEGENVAGRKVRAVGPRKTFEAVTDEFGVYEIYDLPAGRYRVETELPRGWRIAEFWAAQSASYAGGPIYGGGPSADMQRGIPAEVAARKHASIDIVFEVDNAIAGKIFDAGGKPMDGVCLELVPAEGETPDDFSELDCTEGGGSFRIDEVPPGRYVLLVNDDGEVTANEPFGAFYYPNTPRREEATVFTLGPGDFIEGLEIRAPVTAETVTVEGVFLYSDGKPVVDEMVTFRSEEREKAGKSEADARTRTDARGRFTIKLLRGVQGRLRGEMYTYVGEFENCPKLEQVIKRSGHNSMTVETPPVELRSDTNLYNVELRYPFPGCKKAKESN